MGGSGRTAPGGADEETALTAMLAAAYPAAGDDGTVPEADTTALAVLEETAEYLGAGFSDLINLFQPERILVGGWAGLQLGARFLESVRAYATSYALSYPAAHVHIGLGTLGPDAVTVGGAILPLDDFFARGGRPREAARRSPPPPGRRPSSSGRRTERAKARPPLGKAAAGPVGVLRDQGSRYSSSSTAPSSGRFWS